MIKDITYKIEAREALKRGVNALTDTVKITLGPQGRNVMLGMSFGVPLVTKDGVTVAKTIYLEDPLENMGAQLVKSVASKTNEKAGDGTTTATVLAQAIVEEGVRNIVAGANPMELKKGIDYMSKAVIEELKKNSRKIGNSGKELVQIATISANDDVEVGNMIGKAFETVGRDGVISIEDSRTHKTYVDLVEGMQFDQGFVSPYFVTNPQKMECVLEGEVVRILIYNGEINVIEELIKTLEFTSGKGYPLLIIAKEVKGNALGSLIANKVEAGVKVCVVKPPGYGERRISSLEDIACLTGGKVLSENKGNALGRIKEEMLGKCTSVKVDGTTCTIVDGAGTQEMIGFRIGELKSQIGSAENDYEKEKLEERIAKLKGGVGVIYVGGGSEVEIKERKARIEDAKNATKAALEEGIILGGGVALISAGTICKQIFKDFKGSVKVDKVLGMKILLKAIEQPFKQILLNAGLDVSVILNKIKSSKRENYGYDAREEKYVNDMFKAGIVDPVKVTRIALENAASVAGMILTTEATVTDSPKDIDPTKQLPHF